MSEPEVGTEGSGWTKENLQKLFTAMKSNIPECYRVCPYSKGLKSLDWNKVAFPPFSPQACQEKWRDILHKMRKHRSLTELIVEAEEVLSNPAQNTKTHYLAKHLLGKDEYKTRLQEFRKEQHPTSTMCKNKKRKKLGGQHTDGTEGLPPKPLYNGYNLFCKEQMTGVQVSKGHRPFAVWSQHWRDLTERQRDEYNARCIEMKRQYDITLNKYLQTLDEEEQQHFLNENGIKRPKKRRGINRSVKRSIKFPGEPKMPPRSSNIIFFKNQMELLKEEFPNTKERFIRVSQMWQNLSTKEKLCYKEKVHENVRKYLTELQTWFQRLTATEQKDFLKCNPKQCQHLHVKQSSANEMEEVFLSRPSDSEDEDLEDSSSEEEDDLDCDEDEEEEEEGDITFGVF